MRTRARADQLERALAFLYTYPAYADEAVHLALALHQTGLLRTTNTRAVATDGLLLDHEARTLQPLASKSAVVWTWMSHFWTRALANEHRRL